MPSYANSVHDNYDNYGYTPSLVTAVIFLVIYSLSTAIHTYQSFTRTSPRFMILMAIGSGVEVIGWAGRIWSRYDWYADGYIMQICCLIFGPTFYSAALYFLLGLIIKMVAQEKSYISARNFGWLFIGADFFTLVLQGAGGGIAATANSDSASDAGSKLMLAGIIIQLVLMLVYVTYGLLWTRRAQDELLATGWSIPVLLFVMALSSLGIIIRGCFRTGELAQGWNGSLATNQNMFLLDAIPISIATLVLNVWHPNRLLTGFVHGDSASTSQATFVDMKTVPAAKEAKETV